MLENHSGITLIVTEYHILPPPSGPEYTFLGKMSIFFSFPLVYFDLSIERGEMNLSPIH